MIGCGRYLFLVLELGGKNPLVVMPSADIDNAVAGANQGAFGTGQHFIRKPNRSKDVYDEFMEKFMEKVKSTRIGDSLQPKDVLAAQYCHKIRKRFLGWSRNVQRIKAKLIWEKVLLPLK